jgi:hypothetical protein
MRSSTLFLNPSLFLVQETNFHTHIKQRVKFLSVCFNIRLSDTKHISADGAGVTKLQLLARILYSREKLKDSRQLKTRTTHCGLVAILRGTGH